VRDLPRPGPDDLEDLQRLRVQRAVQPGRLVHAGCELAHRRVDADAGAGEDARVVSMPSWELFAAQDEAYRDGVLPRELPKVSVEAGISQGWERWVDRSVSIERFGASAPGPEVLERLGITPEAVAGAAVELVAEVRA